MFKLICKQFSLMTCFLLTCSLSAAIYASQIQSDTTVNDSALDVDEGGVPIIIGNAREPTTGEHLYTEYHYLDAGTNTTLGVAYDLGIGNHIRVVYRDSHSRVIAVKKIQHATIGKQPALLQVNYLVGEEIEVSPIDGGRFSVRYRGESNGEEKRKALEYSDALVVDAGFDGFIRENWSLQDGERMTFDFLAPSRLTTFSFDLKSVDCSGAQGVKCFEVAPSSWLLKRFVEPIRVDYDAKDKRLLKFSGLGNIADASGDYMSVDIEYKYPSYHF